MELDASGTGSMLKRVLLYGLPAAALLVVIVPSYRRARSTQGVQGGLGDVRTLLSAEAGYAAVNGGYYDVPSCLVAPARCIPGARPDVPGFVDARMGRLEPREGYQFRFAPGPPAALKGDEGAKVSKSSLASFAVVAVPLPAIGYGRAFCGDSSGRICARADGSMPPIQDGRCPEECETLR
jgi:hypothetical protein